MLWVFTDLVKGTLWTGFSLCPPRLRAQLIITTSAISPITLLPDLFELCLHQSWTVSPATCAQGSRGVRQVDAKTRSLHPAWRPAQEQAEDGGLVLLLRRTVMRPGNFASC